MIWFGWQLVAATQTVDVQLTKATLLHFGACNACFYLGLFALSRVSQMTWFWNTLLLGFVWVLWMGLCQHFGGLEATRQMISQQPNWQQLPPEYLMRMASKRIFSTLVYPNALAGAILLLIPRTSGLSALMLAGIMICAVVTHVFIVDGSPLGATILLVVTSLVAWGRRQRTMNLLTDLRSR